MVGHISLNFSAQDTNLISDDFMRQVAGEYMQKMGITDTQFIVVRHNDREHPHCHIVFNRVDNDGRTISDQNDRLRSVRACREITERPHGEPSLPKCIKTRTGPNAVSHCRQVGQS